MSERIVVAGDATIQWNPNIYKDQPLSLITIELMHVRAANDICIEYSGDRDGWVITQLVTTGYENKEGVDEPIEVRKELAFIPAWDVDEVQDPS